MANRKSNAKSTKSKAEKNKKESNAKSTKSKAGKNKKVVSLAPRSRLEPRHTPLPSKKKKVSQNSAIERDLCFEENIYDEENTATQEMSFEQDSSTDEQRNETSDAMSSSAADENMNYDIESRGFQSPEKDDEVAENCSTGTPSVQKKKKKERVRKIRNGFDWSDRERMDLALALQTYGFSDIKKLTECVKTKNEKEIPVYLRLRREEVRRVESNTKCNHKKANRGDRWNTFDRDHVASWPNLRKWRKLAYQQMLQYTRSKDYSKPVLTSLCQKFYEEEEEPADPQVINVKSIYKYMMNCMAGEVPPQLPPKESALVLDLLREVRAMPIIYDFEEERKFLQDFRNATAFKPFQVKDEFMKRYKKEPEEMFPPNTVSVPEQVFLDLSRHKRLTQSFSPMVTPVWMLQKEQEILEKYHAESNVYVD